MRPYPGLDHACLVALGACLGVAAAAGRAQAGEVIALEGARVLPVSGPPLERATVLLEGEQIRDVGVGIAIPKGALTIDARGKTITPGLVDAGSSVGLVEITLLDPSTDETQAGGPDPVHAAFSVTDGLNHRSVLIPVTRMEGVTSVLATPAGGLVHGQSAWIDLVQGPDLVARDRTAMHAALGRAGGAAVGGGHARAIERLRELLDDARTYARRRRDYDNNRTRSFSASRLDLEALGATLRGAQPLVLQVERAADILGALRLAADYQLRLVLSGATEAWMVAGDLARARVPVILRPMRNLPESFEALGCRFDAAKLLRDAGVEVLFTTAPSDAHDTRGLRQQAGNAVRAGLDHAAALRAVTLAPASVFGLADRYGSLQPGRVANLVVWSGDPFELSTRAERVFVRGREVVLRSRQTELFERYRRLDRARE